MKGKLASLLVMAFAATIATGGYTFSYFSDIEKSKGNVFTAGTEWGTIPEWGQAENLCIDNSCVCATGCSCSYGIDVDIDCGKLKFDISKEGSYSRGGIHFIKLWNEGGKDITVSEIKISWIENLGEKVETVLLWDWDWSTDLFYWTGSEPSGTPLDIDDFTLYPKTGPLDVFIIGFLFNGDMRGKEVTLRFIMEDSSWKELIFTPDNCCPSC